MKTLQAYLTAHPKAHADTTATPGAVHLYPNGEDPRPLYELDDYHVGSVNGPWLFLGAGAPALRYNSLEIYAKTGATAGRAMRRRDFTLASETNRWLSRALQLEKDPYRTQARETYNEAYREEARAR